MSAGHRLKSNCSCCESYHHCNHCTPKLTTILFFVSHVFIAKVSPEWRLKLGFSSGEWKGGGGGGGGKGAKGDKFECSLTFFLLLKAIILTLTT